MSWLQVHCKLHSPLTAALAAQKVSYVVHHTCCMERCSMASSSHCGLLLAGGTSTNMLNRTIKRWSSPTESIIYQLAIHRSSPVVPIVLCNYETGKNDTHTIIPAARQRNKNDNVNKCKPPLAVGQERLVLNIPDFNVDYVNWIVCP